MSVTPLSNATFPNDLLCGVFQQGTPHLKDLVLWSLVNKQFYRCSLDLSLWQQLAVKHEIVDCTESDQIKESMIRIARRALHRRAPWFDTWYKTPTPLICHDVHTQYAKKGSPSLLKNEPIRFARSSGKPFPITWDDKTYSIKTTQPSSESHHRYCLEIGTPHSIIKKIVTLQGVSDSQPKGGVNGDVLILDEKIGDSSYLKLLYLKTDPPLVAEGGSPYIVCAESTAPIIEPYFFCTEYQNPVEWELFRGSLVYTIYRRPPAHPDMHCDEVRYINYALKPLVDALEKLKEIEQKQICLLTEFLPKNAEIPPHFLCRISGKIMSNPVRDRCLEEKDGHVFEKKAILDFLSKSLPEVEDAHCPISSQVMPRITMEWLKLNPGDNKDVVVNINNGLTSDVHLQREILAWLQNQVGQNLEIGVAALKETSMQSFIKAFSLVPPSYRQEVYGHLRDIRKPANFYDGMGADALYKDPWKDSTLEEKMEALRRCIHREEIDALEWMF